MFILKTNEFKRQNDKMLSTKKFIKIDWQFFLKPIGPANSEPWYELFCSVKNKKQ